MSGDEAMTDGAGLMSPKLEELITTSKGLRHHPSGFQGRIGSAKGFWAVDHSDKSGEIWIEINESQQKWVMDDLNDHPSQRTFEVLQFSKPLKQASLNMQFLPLLVDRAVSPEFLLTIISNHLLKDIGREFDALQGAMTDPQLLREWIWDISPGLTDRLKNGVVTFKAGLPESVYERINVLLDAGFHPLECNFLCDQALRVSKRKFEQLRKRLNIAVDRSTNAYMVPDQTGTIEENQVFLHFSGFEERAAGIAGDVLDGIDVLVARNPAHYPSDIQKMKAVFKAPLVGYKDVILFSTKGTISGAKKLSGGDFDGDKAWVCWDPEIVGNFTNVEVPQCPDLVKQGILSKDSATYKDVVSGHTDPISVFLLRSFLFNVQRSPLGTCTKLKEKLCYHKGTVSSSAAIELSTLLSSLVDLAKAGFAITPDGWERIRSLVKGLRTPAYEENRLDDKSPHIIDKLLVVADKAVNEMLIEIHKRFTKPPHTAPHLDKDLVKLSQMAKESAKTSTEYASIIETLEKDIQSLKADWSRYWASGDKKRKQSADAFLADLYERYQTISPSNPDTPLTRWLLPSCLPDPDMSEWALLKASVLFDSYPGDIKRQMAWVLAGKQLCHLKVRWSDSGASGMSVTARMYAIGKPNSSLIKRLKSEEIENVFLESRAYENDEDDIDAEDQDPEEIEGGLLDDWGICEF
jgi:hypothetical protein